ncbi:MAG: OmpA family protein [Saprospiraceae bacterium]
MKKYFLIVFLICTINPSAFCQENTFEWNDSTLKKKKKREIELLFAFDGPCSSRPCYAYEKNGKTLDTLISFLKINPSLKIVVGYHQDQRGKEKYNQRLSEIYAKGIVEELIIQGANKERITWKGYGETMPLISESQIRRIEREEQRKEAYRRNNRIEVVILKNHFNEIDNGLKKPKYTFEDIEQIKSEYLKSLKQAKSSEIIIYTKWFIGSFNEQTLERESYRNHFDMYVLWKDKKGESFFLEIDNFDVSEEKRKRFRKVYRYLKSNFSGIIEEKLFPKTEQFEYQGKMVDVAVPFVDHEPEYQIQIYYEGKDFEYRYRPSWKSNEDNLKKKQYHLIRMLENVFKGK